MALRTLEAIIAGLIVIGILAAFSLQPQPERTEQLQRAVYAQLVYLDQLGQLRQLVANGNVSGLSAALNLSREAIVRICESANCTATVPADRTVVVVDYYIAGWRELEPRLVRVWVW